MIYDNSDKVDKKNKDVELMAENSWQLNQMIMYCEDKITCRYYEKCNL